MTRDQERLYDIYMKMSKKELAEILTIISTNNSPLRSAPLQDGIFPPNYLQYKCPTWRPIEEWYTNIKSN
jgi:hypothetical protein